MRRRYIQARDGHLIEVTQERSSLPSRSPEIMRDIKSYRSMIDGTWISSRSRHREHLKAHNCVEVGNDASLHRQPKPLESPPGLKKMLIEVANEKLRFI